MAKMFRTSGTGAQQQTLDTTDEKIKIYATDTALDTDLANIPDGEIVATKESAGGGGSGYVGEIPLGTWASFESDTAPNSEWLQAGTTFDANVYPALAMMLGGNTVPERFDHNRLGDYETLATATTWTALYDGIFIYVSKALIMLNDKLVSTTANSFSNTIEVKKGDVITISSESSHICALYAYYSHPLFIKATPTSNDSDYEGTLDSIRDFYVRNNTYSTEERATGGYWIDGKPIYRKVVVSETQGAMGVGDWYRIYTDTAQVIENLLDVEILHLGTTSARYVFKSLHFAYGRGQNNQIQAVATGQSITAVPSGMTRYAILEYTKTTD